MSNYPLPTELLVLITGFASQSTLASLALTSKTISALSIIPLYTSIPQMDAPRAVQCLGTLATNTRLAQLVRSYYLVESTEFDDSRSLSEVIAVALENMIGLTELFLSLGPNFSSEVLRRATFKLQGLT
ncbi:hypothetical protein FRC09_004563, partial [Ceratobasidium sp. 395]